MIHTQQAFASSVLGRPSFVRCRVRCRVRYRVRYRLSCLLLVAPRSSFSKICHQMPLERISRYCNSDVFLLFAKPMDQNM
ncbi:hypothetical protein I7I50_01752 [Histoplasma capsulatum G186AR]|uniref:Uncharacterized protein n=1 Tax=Ajellomyces capsulatus TaxID=5037 RepID=A0A8H7YEQ4_AJECA|nr:hypothetical protein I7I52_11966 [Histoplasma capsulatum]QSS71040.1 hypothetical protein I7I50_01752 [Histoplasma capsulatum G186AR]